jgi:hypothetical protein
MAMGVARGDVCMCGGREAHYDTSASTDAPHTRGHKYVPGDEQKVKRTIVTALPFEDFAPDGKMGGKSSA